MPLMLIPGIGELILIFGVVFLLFGAKKLPGLGGAIGESIKNFKKGIRDEEEEKKQLAQGTPPSATTTTTTTVTPPSSPSDPQGPKQ